MKFMMTFLMDSMELVEHLQSLLVGQILVVSEQLVEMDSYLLMEYFKPQQLKIIQKIISVLLNKHHLQEYHLLYSVVLGLSLIHI